MQSPPLARLEAYGRDGRGSNEGGLMNPLPPIEPEGFSWLGLLILLCWIGAEYLASTQSAEERPTSFVERERQRRAQRNYR